jgi:hypothetical protein
VKRAKQANPRISTHEARRETTRVFEAWARDHSEDVAASFAEDEGRDPTPAELRGLLREVAGILRLPKHEQSDRDRTRALRLIMQIGPDQYYENGVLITGGMEAIA